MGTRNRVTFTVFGDEYTVFTTASPSYVKRLAQRVDAVMRRLAERSPRLAPARLAVLAALSLADEAERGRREAPGRETDREAEREAERGD
jgi:cell division protein ZapA